ncbi:hypothetical protein M0651_12480 [Paenibacillus sp. MBLB2552]|uniref:YqzN/YkzM domain-containing protein n=1 Tax=Paenibacillus mellifer TaxID=2937794 RepID=A0A9X1XXU7_9BACL|nr:MULTISPECIES: hypothetical protein [Paenibacillus]MCK8487990.1 hypothetical protein [Paenibacillus mellifer]MDU2243169.1 hypothetical protein [Paenibacillus sp.]
MAGKKSRASDAVPALAAADVSTGYRVEELLACSEAVLGVKPEILAGAMLGRERKLLQMGEAKRLVDQFLRKKVL